MAVDPVQADRHDVICLRRLLGGMEAPNPDLFVGEPVGYLDHPRSLIPLPHADVLPLRWRRWRELGEAGQAAAGGRSGGTATASGPLVAVPNKGNVTKKNWC